MNAIAPLIHYTSLERNHRTVCGKLLFEDGRRLATTVITERITCPRCRDLLRPWMKGSRE